MVSWESEAGIPLSRVVTMELGPEEKGGRCWQRRKEGRCGQKTMGRDLEEEAVPRRGQWCSCSGDLAEPGQKAQRHQPKALAPF